jgi:hypothetical protein
MTMIISSYTSIHPFLGAYIIHSVYDKPISLQDQTLFTTIYKQTFSGQNTLYVDSIQFMQATSNIFIQFTNISLGEGRANKVYATHRESSTYVSGSLVVLLLRPKHALLLPRYQNGLHKHEDLSLSSPTELSTY